MDLILRRACDEDAQAMIDILNPIIADGGITAYRNEFDVAGITRAYIADGDRRLCLVAEDAVATRVLGFQMVEALPEGPGETGNIATFVDLCRIKSGAGGRLFGAMCGLARKAGFSQLNATIRGDNRGGLAFYSKQGFVRHSVTEASMMRNGICVERVNMRFDLH